MKYKNHLRKNHEYSFRQSVWSRSDYAFGCIINRNWLLPNVYLPEQLAKPDVDEHVLHPVKSTIIEMIMGSANADQQDNFVPKLVNLQLSIDNHVIWDNVDETAHTVTPDHRYSDGYSGDFGSTGVIKPGETYEFLFTEAPPNIPVTIEYHCDPHPWMTGTVVV